MNFYEELSAITDYIKSDKFITQKSRDSDTSTSNNGGMTAQQTDEFLQDADDAGISREAALQSLIQTQVNEPKELVPEPVRRYTK